MVTRGKIEAMDGHGQVDCMGRWVLMAQEVSSFLI